MTESTGNICDIKLPGYTLDKKIGAGGYGEVWLANAPGGLTKAVKFIFGYHNEKRAASELRSLEKIKSVRHPFLLSLERIEVIEGRLVIVTELADGSLKDRFENCLLEGEVGIPREELLGYLRDSADALDYLSSQHSLQHLDIKPENLLLLAGHVKVADFGLVKEIQETQVSLVGGLTPLYSSPEVFQGQPTSFSDQYSLAVLYQEMLTGKTPFSGATAAELTLQHMHDDPDLSPLPLSDRYVVARALSKNPLQRYPSCKELVQALLNVNQQGDTNNNDWVSRPVVQASTPQNASATPNAFSQPGTVTQVFDEDEHCNLADISDSMLIDLPSAEEFEASPLGPLDLQAEDFQPTPTLVIGIGGTAGHVLSQFRKRLNSQFGIRGKVPSVQLLLLDSDKKSLLETAFDDADEGLTTEETLALQLRRPQEYRDSSSRLLGWISRRWLYNIPKSLRTEGLRPLGRLAFADHARRAIQRVRLSLSQAMEVDSIKQSEEQTGLKFNGQAVRVYVVASISGGTGSGMSIDMGYAVRGLLEKLGIENATITGLMLHSTGRDSRYCDLAKVNAFSWFKEFNHFSRPEGYYPGDEGSGLLAMPVGTPVFDNTYFLPLGNGLTLEELKQSTDKVAQYLMLDTLSAAQNFFAASRGVSSPNTSDFSELRTFGLHEKKAASQWTLDAVAQQVCHRVVLGWSGAESEVSMSDSMSNEGLASEQESTALSDTNQLICGAPQAVAQLHLNLEGISANARTILESQFGSNVEALLSKLVAENELQGKSATSTEMLKLVDTLFAPAPDQETAGGDYVFGRRLDAIVSPLGMKLASDLQRWLLHRLDERQERLAGTRLAAEWFVDHLQRVEFDAQRIANAICKQLVAIVAQNSDSEETMVSCHIPESGMELVVKYFRLRLDLRALQATGHLVRMLRSELQNVRVAIVEFGRHLRHLADQLTLGSEGDIQQQAADADRIARDPIGQLLRSRLDELTVRVDQELQEQFINEQGGLLQAVMGNRKVMADLLSTLLTIAKQQVAVVAREQSLAGEQALDTTSLAAFADQARSPLLVLGGAANQLVILPQKKTNASLALTIRKTLGSETSLLTGADGSLVVCSEVGQLPLARVAVDLIECRRDYADYADRVHTRNDIIWAPLIDAKVPTSTNSSEVFTQVL